MMKASLTMR